MRCPSCGAVMSQFSIGATCLKCGLTLKGGGSERVIPPGAGGASGGGAGHGGSGPGVIAGGGGGGMAGDRPYLDWHDFNIKKGDRIGVKFPDGHLFTGIVKSVDEDKTTGEVRLTMEDQ